MRRVEVSRRLGSAEEVRGSLAAHRGRIDGHLAVQYQPLPETGFSYQAMFDHMDAELAKIGGRLVASEDRHVRQLARTRELRRRRARSTSETYDKQTSARGIIASLYGKAHDFEVAAVSGTTPQSSRALAEQVDQTVKFLRNPEVAAPSSKVAGVGVDFRTMADDLEAGRRQLIEVRAELVQATKEADGTRQTTAELIKEFDRIFLWIARSLESLFRLAGESELADRIRTSARRVTRRQAEPAEPAQPPPEGSVEERESVPAGAAEASALDVSPARAAFASRREETPATAARCRLARGPAPEP